MLWLAGDCEEELVTALQHFCIMMPPARRRQLQVLLRYLGKISSNPRLVLHDHFTNRQQVCASEVISQTYSVLATGDPMPETVTLVEGGLTKG